MNTKSIRARSKKRAAQERDYNNHIRPKYLEQHPNCEATINRDICSGVSSQVHHKKGRIGELLNDTKYFMAVCHYCHIYIEAHPDEAKQKGWSISRLAK